MKAKVIKASVLIRIRSNIRQGYRGRWGFDIWDDEKVRAMGEDEGQGGDSFDDTTRTAEILNLLDRLIKQCKPLD